MVHSCRRQTIDMTKFELFIISYVFILSKQNLDKYAIDIVDNRRYHIGQCKILNCCFIDQNSTCLSYESLMFVKWVIWLEILGLYSMYIIVKSLISSENLDFELINTLS